MLASVPSFLTLKYVHHIGSVTNRESENDPFVKGNYLPFTSIFRGVHLLGFRECNCFSTITEAEIYIIYLEFSSGFPNLKI